MKRFAMLAIAAVATTIAVPATAHADAGYEFQSPSGNIRCMMYTSVGADKPHALCEITDHTWTAPAQSIWGCPLAPTANQFRLNEGEQPGFACATQHMPPSQRPVLEFGQSRTTGALTCESEPSGITCRDAGTSHFFRVSQESYELG
jgi:hypothetical protein